jgi:hypothetical protein
MLDVAPGTKAGTPHNPLRGSAQKTINTFSACRDWSRAKTYRLIADGALKTVRIGGRQYITAAAEADFDEAAEKGLLDKSSK